VENVRFLSVEISLPRVIWLKNLRKAWISAKEQHLRGDTVAFLKVCIASSD